MHALRDDAGVLELSERSVELPQSTGRDSKPNLHLNAAPSRPPMLFAHLLCDDSWRIGAASFLNSRSEIRLADKQFATAASSNFSESGPAP